MDSSHKDFHFFLVENRRGRENVAFLCSPPNLGELRCVDASFEFRLVDILYTIRDGEKVCAVCGSPKQKSRSSDGIIVENMEPLQS